MSLLNWKLLLMKKIIRSECIVYYCVFIGAGSLELILCRVQGLSPPPAEFRGGDRRHASGDRASW